MDHNTWTSLLRRANDVALRAKSLGRRPFGCLLAGPDGEELVAPHRGFWK